MQSRRHADANQRIRCTRGQGSNLQQPSPKARRVRPQLVVHRADLRLVGSTLHGLRARSSIPLENDSDMSTCGPKRHPDHHTDARQRARQCVITGARGATHGTTHSGNGGSSWRPSPGVRRRTSAVAPALGVAGPVASLGTNGSIVVVGRGGSAIDLVGEALLRILASLEVAARIDGDPCAAWITGAVRGGRCRRVLRLLRRHAWRSCDPGGWMVEGY
jgi:hypothetical protein